MLKRTVGQSKVIEGKFSDSNLQTIRLVEYIKKESDKRVDDICQDINVIKSKFNGKARC